MSLNGFTKNRFNDLNVNTLTTTGDADLCNTLYVDCSTGNVGIGTATPDTLLHIEKSQNTTVPLFQVENLHADGDASIMFKNTDNTFVIGCDATTGEFKISDSTALGTNDRLTILSSGNVGIGTDAPSTLLNVQNTAISGQQACLFENTQSAEGCFIEINNEAGTRALFGTDGTGFGGGSTSDMILGNWSNGALAFRTNATERMRILAGGNVGIGTATPDTLLHIEKSQNTTVPLFQVENLHADGDASIMFKNTDNTFVIGCDATTGEFKISDSTALGTNDRLTIDSSGNVGIGTNAPNALLHLVGTATGIDSINSNSITIENSSGSTSEVGIRLQNFDTGSNFWYMGLNQSANFALAYGTDFSNTTTLLTTLTSGNIGIDGSYAPTISLAIGEDDTGINHPATDVITIETGNLERVRVDASGRVGIGTATIASKLHIHDTSHLSPLFQTSGTDVECSLNFQTAEQFWKIGMDNDNGTGDPDDFVIKTTNNAEPEFIIENTGNVGIGTGNPSAPLHVQNTTTQVSLFENTDSLKGSFIEIKNEAGTRALFGPDGTEFGGGSTSDVIVGNWSNGDLAFHTNAIERLRILAGGNVGIGNTDPTITLAIGENDTGINHPATDVITIETANAERLRVQADGFVGIGTNSTTTPLHVQNTTPQVGLFENTTTLKGSYIEVKNEAGTRALFGADGGEFGGGATTDVIVGNWSNGDLSFHANATEHMRIESAGNVGIGTDAPAGKLEVSQQSTTAAIPVLELEQLDIDQAFINVVGASSADLLNPISTHTTPVVTGHFRIEVNGAPRYIAFSTTPTA